MRQNNKSSGAEPAIGEQLVNFAPRETSDISAHADDSLIMSQEPPRAGDGVAHGVLIEDVKVDEQDEIARDMTLLADVVIRRRAAGRVGRSAQDWRDSLVADSSDTKGPAFPPVSIALRGENEVHVVDTIERAIECLTTLWPVRNGEAFEGALQSCIDGIKGRVSPQQVRSAFVHAADTAGILRLP